MLMDRCEDYLVFSTMRRSEVRKSLGVIGGVMTKQLDDLIDSIMKGYQKRVPQLNHLLEKMKEEKLVDSIKDIENDHFAFRI